MSPPEVVFSLFSRFPPEIRLAIWHHCIPHRIVELDHQQDDIIWDQPPCKINWKISCTNRAPPLIARICRESRDVAFGDGRGPLSLPDLQKNADTQSFSHDMIEHPWLDLARDSVHLNWDADADIEWETYNWGDPVRCLLWHAARTKSRQASIVFGHLQAFQHRRNPDEPHSQYRWTRSQLADLMRTKQRWTVVILPPIIVHTNAETAAGLFGLLADARVQIVDADDETSINEFMKLGEASNVTIGPGFAQEDLIRAKKELRGAVESVFGTEDSAPTTRPAVMFRLCTGKCK